MKQSNLHNKNIYSLKKDIFHDVLNKSVDWVWRATPDAVFTYLSPSLKTMTGFDPEDLIGKPFSEYAPQLLTEKSIQIVIESLSKRNEGEFGDSVRRFELVYKRKDGSEFVGEMCSAPVLNSSGEMIAIQGTTRDMTSQKLLVDELRHSIELFSTFFHSNNNPCCMTDLETGVVMYANASWLSNFDCTLDDILGCTLSNLGVFESAGQDQLDKVLDRVKESSNPIQSDMELLTKSGEEQLCTVTSFSVDIAGVQRVFTSIVDNTNNAKIVKELSKVAKLESANTLVTDVAHELSNKLTGVVANLKLAQAAESESAREEYLNKTNKAATWLGDLTQQLLELTEIEGSRREYTDIEELLRETVSLCLHGSHISYKINATPDLWHANINPEQISQVINNIVINAQQAMPNGGSITVTVENFLLESNVDSPLKPGRYIKVSVTDQGMGIAEDIESKVFDAFFSSKKNGSGLGLASARSIIEKSGGQIEVTSTSSFGTTLGFYLPADSNNSNLKVVPGKKNK